MKKALCVLIVLLTLPTIALAEKTNEELAKDYQTLLELVYSESSTPVNVSYLEESDTFFVLVERQFANDELYAVEMWELLKETAYECVKIGSFVKENPTVSFAYYFLNDDEPYFYYILRLEDGEITVSSDKITGDTEPAVPADSGKPSLGFK